MLSRLWFDIVTSTPEVLAAIFLVLVAIAFSIGIVWTDVRDARRCRLVSAEELKRDQETAARRRRLRIFQGGRGVWRRSA